ncbi:MAG TPA: YraN family protein [Vicinamibacterales bacterium]|nr:YraN family protein [Vicinamibacterales bacterium]
MTIERQKLGESGEDLAADELAARGYAIVARRHRLRGGEIDIIARDGETLVFVEVRRRSHGDFGSAAESVTPWKQRQVVRMAVEYLAREGLYDKCPVRFDVVAIDDRPSGAPRIVVIPGAFDASACGRL